MVGARDLLLHELVEAKREALGETAVVDEQDRRAVLLHEAQQLRVDGRPDRLLRSFRAGAGLAHVLEGHDHLQV